MTMFNELSAPFPPEAVSWRAQTVIKDRDGDGYKAMALAYIDARDVMARLDEVCGPENWEDAYTETAKGRVIGTIRIFHDGRWISKSDGAGDTAVEGEKGGISDAFKRTAVKWGIGRYLYDMPTPWAACAGSTKNDRHYFKKWLPSAEAQFRQLAAHAPLTRTSKPDDSVQALIRQIEACDTSASLQHLWTEHADSIKVSSAKELLTAAKDKRKAAISEMERLRA